MVQNELKQQNNTKFNIYLKLIGFLTKEGKKLRAKHIVDSALNFLKKKTKKSLFYIFFKFFLKLNVYVEAKILRIKRSKYTVPFIIHYKRRFYLIFKWLLKAVLENKQKISLSLKISQEILDVLNNKKDSKILKYKTLNNMTCIKNRSNLHYRW